MKDKILRICSVLLVVFLLLFRLISEIKREVGNRKIWVEAFRKINRWELEKDILHWKSFYWEPDVTHADSFVIDSIKVIFYFQ